MKEEYDFDWENVTRPWLECPLTGQEGIVLGKVWIYGIYAMQGHCLYVGQTKHFGKRWHQHRHPTRGKFGSLEVVMLPLVLVPRDLATQTERQYQNLMESIGQAEVSKRKKKLLTSISS